MRSKVVVVKMKGAFSIFKNRAVGLSVLRRQNSACRSGVAASGRLFSTDLNRDNMSQYHREASHVVIPPQEWTSYRGKIPMLKSDMKEASSQNASNDIFGEQPRVSVLMELTDHVGILHDVLKYFWKYDINVTRIESRPVAPCSSGQPKFDFYIDFDGSLDDTAVQKVLDDISPFTEKLLVLDEKDVRWFPRHISELDGIAHRTLDAGIDLESDHPGFHDPEYRKRRSFLAKNASQYTFDQDIPFVEYTLEEKETWKAVWDRMEGLWDEYACKEYLVSKESVLRSAFCKFIVHASHSLQCDLYRFQAFDVIAERALWIRPRIDPATA